MKVPYREGGSDHTLAPSHASATVRLRRCVDRGNHRPGIELRNQANPGCRRFTRSNPPVQFESRGVAEYMVRTTGPRPLMTVTVVSEKVGTVRRAIPPRFFRCSCPIHDLLPFQRIARDPRGGRADPPPATNPRNLKKIRYFHERFPDPQLHKAWGGYVFASQMRRKCAAN